MTKEEQELSPEQKELVAVAASVAAGCHPCVDHHLKAGAKAGLQGEQLLAALTSAERVSAEAAVRIGDHVRDRLGAAAPALLPRLDEALASLGAALAANDARKIERQLRAALELGASRPQLARAIEAAQSVQEHAARIHRREAERLLDSLAPAAAAAQGSQGQPDQGCGCSAAEEEAPTAAEASSAVTERHADPAAGDPSGVPEGFRGPLGALFDAGSAGGFDVVAECRRMFERMSAEPRKPAMPERPGSDEDVGSCCQGARREGSSAVSSS